MTRIFSVCLVLCGGIPAFSSLALGAAGNCPDVAPYNTSNSFKCWYGTDQSDWIWVNERNQILINHHSAGTRALGRYDSRLINVFFGLGGNDKITGGAGVDFIFGGAGNDVLRGMGGNDWLYGESGSDRLEGGSGEDRLHGGPGRDQIDGGHGRDQIIESDGLDLFKRVEVGIEK